MIWIDSESFFLFSSRPGSYVISKSKCTYQWRVECTTYFLCDTTCEFDSIIWLSFLNVSCRPVLGLFVGS